MRYFADTIYNIWEDIKGLFGPSKAFYTFLGIGLAIWLISATNQATVFSEIGKAIFLFCLIKLAIERAPKRDQENEIVKTLKDIGITDVKSSRASLTLEDVDFLSKAKKRLWIAGFFIDDLLNNEIVSAKSTRSDMQQRHLLHDLLQLAAKPNFDFRLLMLDHLNRGAYLHQTLDAKFVNQCQQKIDAIEAFLSENNTNKQARDSNKS